MKINKVYIKGFGKLKDYEIEFEDGFQVIGAENEFGKSTILEFIGMMFYGKKSGGQNPLKNTRLKYRPWSGGEMGGMIEFEYRGDTYRIEKLFGKSASTDKQLIINITDDKRIELPQGTEAGMYFWGMDADAFERSVFIRQSRMDYKSGDKDYIMENIGRRVMEENENDNSQEALKRIRIAKEELVSKSGRTGRITELKKERTTLEKEYVASEKKNMRLDEQAEEAEHIRNAIESAKIKEDIQRIDAILAGENEDRDYSSGKSKSVWIVAVIFSVFFIAAAVMYNMVFIAGAVISLLAGALYNRGGDRTDDSPVIYRAKMEKSALINKKNKIKVLDKYEDMPINKLKSELSKCERNLGLRTDTEHLKSKISELDNKLADMTKYYEALVHAQEVLGDILNDRRRDYSPELNKRAGEIFECITSGKYDKVMVGSEYNPMVTETGDYSSREWQYLSKGTAEQMYLAVRLAIAESMSSGDTFPIMMDDVLESYDDERLEETMKYLKQLGKKHQIILFTCHGSILRLGK